MDILLNHLVESSVLHLRLYIFTARGAPFRLQTIQAALADCMLTNTDRHRASLLQIVQLATNIAIEVI